MSRLDYDGLLSARLPLLVDRLDALASDARVQPMDRGLAQVQLAIARRRLREHQQRQSETCAEQPRRYMRHLSNGSGSTDRLAAAEALMWTEQWRKWAERVSQPA